MCLAVLLDVCETCLFSGYIYSFASSTSKKLSESVLETAQTLKNSVEEGKINGIFDKVIIVTISLLRCPQSCVKFAI